MSCRPLSGSHKTKHEKAGGGSRTRTSKVGGRGTSSVVKLEEQPGGLAAARVCLNSEKLGTHGVESLDSRSELLGDRT